MPSEDPPITSEELSELEKELSKRKKMSGEKLTEEEIEKAKKEFAEKRKAEKEEEEDTESKIEEETFENAKKSKDVFFTDKNKFVETINTSLIEKRDINERNFIADNIEQRVSSGQSTLPQLFQSQNNRDENKDDFGYSLTNYDNSEEKKYTIENDVDSHMVGGPQRPNNVDVNSVGRKNSGSQFDNQPDFKNPYPENFTSNPDKDYVPKTRMDPEQAGRDEESFFEREFGKKEKKYEAK